MKTLLVLASLALMATAANAFDGFGPVPSNLPIQCKTYDTMGNVHNRSFSCPVDAVSDASHTKMKGVVEPKAPCVRS